MFKRDRTEIGDSLGKKDTRQTNEDVIKKSKNISKNKNPEAAVKQASGWRVPEARLTLGSILLYARRDKKS